MQKRGWRSRVAGQTPFKFRPRNRRRRWTLGATKIATGMLLIIGLSIASIWRERSDEQTAVIYGCSVTDGDTIRCGGERIRLLGIDAPEMPGHCRIGRQCVRGDPVASSASLGSAMSPSMTIVRVGTDRYGRTLASVGGANGDLSCWQLNHNMAEYRSDWDNGFRVGRTCPSAIL